MIKCFGAVSKVSDSYLIRTVPPPSPGRLLLRVLPSFISTCGKRREREREDKFHLVVWPQ